jgi:hypothetical protein
VQLVPPTELHDPTEDEWGPEADTGPRLRSAAVPQLDAFVLPATGLLPVPPVDTDELPEVEDEPVEDEPAEDEATDGDAEPATAGTAETEPGAVEPEAVEAVEAGEAAADLVPGPGFDPGVFRPSRAFLELRELLMANGAADIAGVPEPREPVAFGDLRSLTDDPTDFSGLRPWLESFQQRLGPRTGDVPQVGDRA